MAYAFAGTYGPAPITDKFGHPLTGLTVSIFESGTQNLVQLYTDRTMGTPAANPMVTDDIGNLTFFCAPGQVDISGNGGLLTVVIPPDPADLATLDGSTFTGPVELAADPTDNLGAATKEYVDTHGGGGGGGSVASVFGRTGSVVPLSGDYSGFYTPINTAVPLTYAGTGADVVVTSSLLTVTGTQNFESRVRRQPLNMMATATGNTSFGYQPVSNIGALFVLDGTNADGQVSVLVNPPSVGFGPGNAPSDAIISRTSVGNLTLADGTAGHGSVNLGINPGVVEVFGTSTDTFPVASLTTVLGSSALALGPGGSTIPDLFLIRNGAAQGQWTASSMTWQDGTAGDGSVKVQVATPGVGLYKTSTDVQPALNMGIAAGLPAIGMGPGGSTSPDVSLVRTTTATAQLQLSKLNIVDGTAGHGQVAVGFNSPNVAVFGNSTDAQAAITLGVILGSAGLSLGAGGSASQDVIMLRTGTAAASFTGTLNHLNPLTVLASQSNTYTATPSVPFTVNSGGTVTAGSSFSGNVVLGNQAQLGGTYVFQIAGYGFGSLNGYVFSPTIKNDSAFAVGFGLVTGFANDPTIEADTQTGIGAGTYIGYSSGPAYARINSGTITSATHTGFSAGVTIGAGCTVTTATMFAATGPANSGTLTTWIGLDVSAVTTATTNIGIRNASPYVSTPSTAQVVAAAFTLTANAETVQCTSAGSVSATTGGAVIAAGQNGQRLFILNVNTSANTLTFTSGATELLSLGATTRAVAKGGSLTLEYSSTFGRWIELAFNAGGN